MRRATCAITALLLAVLVSAPAAWGAGIPLSGGEAKLVFDRGFDKELRHEGVTVKALGPAKLKGRNLTLPVRLGTFEPTGNVVMSQSGGFRLTAGGKGVALRQLNLNSEKNRLSATLAGKRIALAELGGAKFTRNGFDARLEVKRLSLTRPGANALNRLLGLPGLLKKGRSLGSIDALGIATSVPISFGQIAIGGPETAFSKLESIKVQMGIWGSTGSWRAPGENYFLFDVAPTTLAPDASTGILEGGVNDGITMQIHEAPPREMLLRHPRIDLATRELSATLSPISTANPVTATIATLDYGAANFQIRPKVGAIELIGIRAISNQLIADQLNERFATPGLFVAGETLARITVNLHAG